MQLPSHSVYGYNPAHEVDFYSCKIRVYGPARGCHGQCCISLPVAAMAVAEPSLRLTRRRRRCRTGTVVAALPWHDHHHWQGLKMGQAAGRGGRRAARHAPQLERE